MELIPKMFLKEFRIGRNGGTAAFLIRRIHKSIRKIGEFDFHKETGQFLLLHHFEVILTLTITAL